MENSEKIKIIKFHNNQLGFDCPCVLRASGEIGIHDQSRMPVDKSELEAWKDEYDGFQLLQEEKKQIKVFEDAVQDYLDTEARKQGYDSIHTAVTYADETSVSKFQAEGKALRKMRSLVWGKCYEILEDVKKGGRGQPTVNGLIDEIKIL